MADLFLPPEVGQLLRHKHVVVLGGSFMRGVYKDLVWLLNHPSIIPREILGAKGEEEFPNLENTQWKKEPCDKRLLNIFTPSNRDKLQDFQGLTAGRGYIEPRKYYNRQYNTTISYRFIVRVFDDDLANYLKRYPEEEGNGNQIDVILFNSCLWDCNRWGPLGCLEYKENLASLLSFLPQHLSSATFFWLTCPIGSEELNSRGMNLIGLEFQCFTTRFNVVEANFVAAHMMESAGYGVIDLHYYLQFQTFRRNQDGIHWDSHANRFVTNLILTHLTLATVGEDGLPNRVKNKYALEKTKMKFRDKQFRGDNCSKEVRDVLTMLEKLPVIRNPSTGLKDEVLYKVQIQLNKELERSRLGEYMERAGVTAAGSSDHRSGPNNFGGQSHRYHPYPQQYHPPRVGGAHNGNTAANEAGFIWFGRDRDQRMGQNSVQQNDEFRNNVPISIHAGCTSSDTQAGSTSTTHSSQETIVPLQDHRMRGPINNRGPEDLEDFSRDTVGFNGPGRSSFSGVDGCRGDYNDFTGTGSNIVNPMLWRVDSAAGPRGVEHGQGQMLASGSVSGWGGGGRGDVMGSTAPNGCLVPFDNHVIQARLHHKLAVLNNMLGELVQRFWLWNRREPTPAELCRIKEDVFMLYINQHSANLPGSGGNYGTAGIGGQMLAQWNNGAGFDAGFVDVGNGDWSQSYHTNAMRRDRGAAHNFQRGAARRGNF